MNKLRKWIALLLLAVFLPATAFAQGCAAGCAFAPSTQQQAQAVVEHQDMPGMGEHCQNKKSTEACPYSAVCDFANLFVLSLAPIQFAAAPPTVAPEFFPADFVSVTYPPALRPPTL